MNNFIYAEESIVKELSELQQHHKQIDPQAYALLKLAQELHTLGIHLKYLGGGDNGSTMGAVELLAVTIKEGLSQLSSSVEATAPVLTD